MRRPKLYSNLNKLIFHPELVICPTCTIRLKRHATLSQRTVITLQWPLHLGHCGYRCPNSGCATNTRVYRGDLAPEKWRKGKEE